MNNKTVSPFKLTALAAAISMASGMAIADQECTDPDFSQAAGFVVTTLVDSDDCNDGEISLREAVVNVNISGDGNGGPRVFLDGGSNTITFDESITSGRIVLDSTIEVYSELTITGPGRDLVLDGSEIDGYGSISIIKSYSPLTVENITLTGARSSAIKSYSSLDLRNVAITESGGGGAAVVSSAAACHSVISGRGLIAAAPKYTQSAEYGGAINHQGSEDLTITNSSFSDNSADAYGGAIFTRSLDTKITGSTFTNNYAGYGGGAVSGDDRGGAYGAMPQPIAALIKDSTFSSNAADFGGAIEFHQYNWGSYGGLLTIDNTTVENNNAYEGGGIVIKGAALSLTVQNGSVVSGNTTYCDGSGGGIRIEPNYFIDNVGQLTIKQSKIINNNTYGNGGGISVGDFYYDESSVPNISISESTISGNNSAYGSGGGIDVQSFYAVNNIVIDKTTIDGNTAYGSGGGLNIISYGALVNPYGAMVNPQLSITDSTLSGNTAIFGGAVSAKYGSGIFSANALVSAEPTFEEVLASVRKKDPEAIAQVDVQSTNLMLAISNSTISGNTADLGSGLFVAYGFDLTVKHTTVSDNHAEYMSIVAITDNVNISHTIVAGNEYENNDYGDIFFSNGYGETSSSNNVSMSYSLIGNDAGLSWSGTANQMGDSENPLDPDLASLRDNGGPTLTMMPRKNSPAVNAGDKNVVAPAKDQRGYKRIQRDRIDIGAVESDISGKPVGLELLESLGYTTAADKSKYSGGYTGIWWLIMAPLMLFRRKRQ